MIRACFFYEDDSIIGFEIDGHSNFSQSGTDIVCAGVSSVAIMVANTLTEICNANTQITQKEGYLKVLLKDGNYDSASCKNILDGMQSHIKQMSLQYPKNITVKNVRAFGKEDRNA